MISLRSQELDQMWAGFEIFGCICWILVGALMRSQRLYSSGRLCILLFQPPVPPQVSYTPIVCASLLGSIALTELLQPSDFRTPRLLHRKHTSALVPPKTAQVPTTPLCPAPEQSSPSLSFFRILGLKDRDQAVSTSWSLS